MIIKDEYNYLITESNNIKYRKKIANPEYLSDFLLDEAKRLEKSVKSHLVSCFLHLLKCEYQPNKTTKSWHNSIMNSQFELITELEDEQTLYNKIVGSIDKCYSNAVLLASKQTKLDKSVFPSKCPWSLDNILDIDFIYKFIDEHPLSNNDTYYERII